MSSNALLRRAVRLALITNVSAASLGLPTIVAAADAEGPAAPAAAPEAAPLQEVVVTGSRVTEPGVQSISPVTSVSAEQIKAQGITKIEDLLNTLPQVVADQGAMSSNGASGTAEVNLRSLGPQRTLVLVNGRRLMPGDPSSKTPLFNAPDLNNIPAALVERVDVLTGGASAVYGADAVAGVVNFVMNDHFQGFRIDANTNAYQHSQHNNAGGFAPAAGYGSSSSSVFDGATKDVTFILGNNFADGKGNATGYIGYRRVGAVTEATRDFSLCTLGTSASTGKVSCAGSSTSATGRFFTANFQADGVTPNPLSPTLTVDTTNGTLRPYHSATDAFNFGPLNYFQRPDERWTAGLFSHYNYDENHEVYQEFMFMSDRTVSQIAPSGAFIGSGTGVDPNNGLPDGAWGVNCNNPYLSTQEQGILCAGLAPTAVAQTIFGRRNIEGGNRRDDLTHTSFRLVLGTKGEIIDGLNYDVYAQEGMTLFSETFSNDVSRSRLSAALQAVTDPLTGKVVCAANANGANGAPGCVPYNIWGTGAVNPAAVAYFTIPGLSSGDTEERVISGNATADLGKFGAKSPLANSGLIVNLGAEWRSESLELRPDAAFIGDGNLSDLAGQGSATLPLNAGFHVYEGFVEARLPLAQDQPFAKDLSFETGYRYSSYSVGFNTNTYKFGVDYAPISDVRLRAGYNRAVRVPNLTELYAEKFVGLDGSADPCAATTTSPAAASAAACARSGMTAAQYGTRGTPANPAGQYNGLVGGNPNLKPEIADTYTVGLVFTPTVLPNLNATIDFYDIKIKNVITSYTANLIVDECVNANVSSFCNSTQEGQFVGVHRDAAGSLWFSPNGYVGDPILNLGYLLARGMDVGVHYRQDIPSLGHMDMSLAGTYTSSFITQPFPGSGTYDCAGYYGATCGNPVPKWKHVFSDTWTLPIPGLSFTARWRYLAATRIELTNASPLLQTVANVKVYQAYSEIPSFSYIDLSAAYQVTKGVTLRLGVNNVMDKDPPILAATNPGYSLPPPFFNGNTYPQVYDTLGRFLFANVTIDF
jgi:iron complex outermembrane recepter protein